MYMRSYPDGRKVLMDILKKKMKGITIPMITRMKISMVFTILENQRKSPMSDPERIHFEAT